MQLDHRQRPSSTRQSSHRVRDPSVSLEPFILPAFEAIRVRSPAITTAPIASTHPPSGCRLGSARCMTCRSNKATSSCMPRLLAAAYHRVRPPIAAGGGSSSQAKHRTLRSPTSPCTAGSGWMQMAVFERFQRGLAVSPGDQRLVLDATRACGSAGPALGQREARWVP